ncbi:protein transport protein Sec24B isoform X2 [Bufo gargarizans]|uniref:protein transport protein Sec24B isoform X2 n=1 Tax=Bufo gargarizans TaxID=30331 RepID=UPI001CF37A72|nr:protein transport protein Sec24B isoform X2 [Bufo gargarizans]
MSAPGPPAAQHNGPAQPRPPHGYRLYPSAVSAPPALCSQVPSKVTPSHTDHQYGFDYHSINYAAPPLPQNPNIPPLPTNHLHSNQGPHQFSHGRSQSDHIPASQPQHQTVAPPVQPYPPFTGDYSYSATSSLPPQGLASHSSHYSAPLMSGHMYQGAPYSSMPASSQYGQGTSAYGTQVTNNAQRLPTAPPHLLHQDLRSLSAPPVPVTGPQRAHDGLGQNQAVPLATHHQQPSAGSPAFAGQTSDIGRPSPAVSASNSVATYPPSGNQPSGSPSPLAPAYKPQPTVQQGMQYDGYVNNQANFAPTPLSSSSDDEEEEEDDEEAGIDESSSTTSSASSEPRNFDVLEGGGYTETPAAANIQPPVNAPSRLSKPFGHGYPALQPGYQNAASPHSSQSSTPVHQPNYPQYAPQYGGMNQLPASLAGLSLQQAQQPESLRPVNLIQDRNVLPVSSLPPPAPNLNADLKKLNCNSEFFRCTLTNIPQTQALLNKAKLPLGLLLHPFKSKPRIPTISPSSIVRCRSCRTYINPFVSFIDQRRWKCNLCYRVNDVPEEFMYNPVTRSYGEPHKRPEVLNSSVEFTASSDYMLRPPPPAVYLFVLDVSYNAVESGYLQCFSQSLLDNLDKLRGDSRTKIGFITFDSTVHFYNLQEGLSQPQMLIVSDVDEIFLPTPDGLLVNLHDSLELIKDLLTALPGMFTSTRETHSALGPALQGACKLMSPTGGRISVFQTQLPSVGAGLLQSREDPNQRSSLKGIQHLGPATDFYKKLALDCSGHQTAVDLFLLSSQYSDLASLACVSKYSAGCIYYYPSFHQKHNPAQAEKLKQDLDHYLTRKIGFEAVMRIRCTKGLSIHTFHGNFFVRSTDLLSLANITEDAGFAVHMSLEESLTDSSLACCQVALLYTSSKGQRRIRVHTLCLPVVNSLPDVFAGADVQAITCLLANMAVDRSITSSLSDARDALVNAVVDSLSSYRSTLSNLQQSTLIAPSALKLFPLYILALLKQKAFRTGTCTRLDDRVFAMCQIKSLPLLHLMKIIHPSLYRIDRLTDEGAILVNDLVVPQPRLQQLSAEKLERDGAFLMDAASSLYLWVGRNCDTNFLKDVLGFPNYASVPQKMTQLLELDNVASERTHNFISWLKQDSPLNSVLYVLKDDSAGKTEFFQHLIEDRSEAAFSYYEFLLHIQQQICK